MVSTPYYDSVCLSPFSVPQPDWVEPSELYDPEVLLPIWPWAKNALLDSRQHCCYRLDLHPNTAIPSQPIFNSRYSVIKSQHYNLVLK